MIQTGRIQELPVLRATPEGLILGDEEDSVLLPVANIPSTYTAGRSVRVFVYRDREKRRLATTALPNAQVGEFAMLQVSAIRGAGAHVNWGIEPHLLVPHEEQQKPLEEGRWYVVRVALNDDTDQPYGSTCIQQYLHNDKLTVAEAGQVDLMVFGRSDLGLSVIVNSSHLGLVHANEIYRHVSLGDRLIGYVKKVRKDQKLDISLQPIGYRQYIDVNTALLAKRLHQNKGFLPLSDKSTATQIHAELGISKKAFKKALGALYKERLVQIGEEGVVWVG